MCLYINYHQVDLEASARAIRRRRQREKELLEEDVSGVILDPQVNAISRLYQNSRIEV